MSNDDDQTPAPFGAPALGTDRPDQPHFESGRPRLGGLATPIVFSETETKVIAALADTIVPPGNGFPAASEVGIADFFSRYTTPTGFRAKHFPYLEEDVLKAALASLGEGFLAAGTKSRANEVERLEKDQEELFTQLRSLVYYGYYSAAEVTTAIQHEIPAGRDYHGPPLPYGYLDCIEDWDEAALASAGQGSGYVTTEDVVRVDLSKLTWPHTQQVKENAK
ncbi:gluconate 2-dehydrogenase subunit 3 family protein [Candidatus Mycolicibacterium alkanivorans]|uniref:Gluconate 2-dehydrogenase subunit 3 family protein n=1 Tax=Candidatus Mycolicibacterium alkanivorans TaxID=2954114 RepID=A0ABS9YXA4_9MYCO|nr:gluconate 2-dehydrogenase subunit 3 family protein [Candidatus Mycolicibacterium alkanivorans]MCI4675845.1 gluconate 2-dehydrogenase subunit 3 family protein [Candidatus Mycolicibacterium alkanivorans]